MHDQKSARLMNESQKYPFLCSLTEPLAVANVSCINFQLVKVVWIVNFKPMGKPQK